MELGVNQKSSMTSYPNHIKFISVDIELSLDSKQTNRDTYSILELFGDVGGIMELCSVFFGLFAVRFSKQRLDALLTNRLYHVNDENQDLIEKI